MNYTVTGYYKDYYSLHVEADSEQDAMEKFRSGNYDHQMNSVEQGKWEVTSVRKENKKTCCICGKEFEGWGNDPWPVVTDEDAVCCDNCDMTVVLSARVNEMQMQHKQSN